MKVAFLVKDLQLSGGVNVVVEHAHQLTRRHGFDVAILRTAAPVGADWPYPGLRHVRVLTLEQAQGERFDVAVATWWETALSLFEVESERHAYFVQLLEDSHYPADSAARLGFGLTLGLPVRFVTEARWIADVIERLQPASPVLYVRNGIAKDVFAPPHDPPPAARDEPLRVLVEGSPRLARKGVPHALEAVGLMRARRHLTLVTNEPPADTPAGVDEHLGALPHAGMAEVFARSHVLVKLSRAEGMYGPPLEGFHMGCTVVTTPVTGHEEYVVHRRNGLVVDWDDPVGTARALDLLARDRGLLQRLREGALRTARTWPSWEEASTVMAEALRTILEDPPPPSLPAGRRLSADLGAVLAEVETRILAERGAREHFRQLREQRTIMAVLAARRAATPLLVRARSLRRRLGSGRDGGGPV